MNKVFFLILIFALLGCEQYVVETRDVTLSGKYVVSKLDITNVDQSTDKDSLYLVGTTFNGLMPKPFNRIEINRFYIHFDYSTIRINLLGVDPYGRDIWEYGNFPNQIFYQILNNNSYYSGHLRFAYESQPGVTNVLTFNIEHDGIESLQLKSSGTWLRGNEGQKQVMTLFLTRVGP
jgi:hypothetical protein